jgi:hypothetical protein
MSILESVLKQIETQKNNQSYIRQQQPALPMQIKPKMTKPEPDDDNIKDEINKLIDDKASIKDVRNFYIKYIDLIEDEYSDY